MDELSIYIENLYNHFKTHLNNNSRVLFSGMYGIGKTYFLKEFFQNEKFKDEYNIFHLFPVNYQVSNNEDIFELIKIDILYHILGKEWKFEEEEQEKISKTLALQAYAINKASSTFKAITQILTLGKSKSVVDGADELEKIISGFTKYYKELNSSESKLDTIREFGQIFENKKGSIYEFDNITQLICELLKGHSSADTEDAETGESSEKKKKESVLIIDDLDRIDPEHIFRILNVFSAHFDIRNEDSNKFGFDKVIFVCDIENIKNIFSTKYGVNTDFNGYMNKFFSSQIYHFDNKQGMKDAIENFLDVRLNQKDVHKRYKLIKEDIAQFLAILISSNKINIRQLKNLETFDFKVSLFNDYRNEYISMLLYWHLIIFLLKIFNNDLSKLKDAFSDLRLDQNDAKSFQINNDIYLKCLVLLADIESVDARFNGVRNTEYLYRNEELDISIKYDFVYTGDYFLAEIKDVISFGSDAFNDVDDFGYGYKNYTRKITLSDISKLFIVAINELERKGMLIRS